MSIVCSRTFASFCEEKRTRCAVLMGGGNGQRSRSQGVCTADGKADLSHRGHAPDDSLGSSLGSGMIISQTGNPEHVLVLDDLP